MSTLKQKYASKIAYPTIFLTVVALASYATSTILAVKSTLPLGLAIAINTIMAYILFTSMHEAGHGNISAGMKGKRWIDEALGWASGLPLMAPFYLFKVIHFRHHAHTNNPEKDPDHWLASKNFLSLLFHSLTIFPVYFFEGIRILNSDERLAKRVRKELKIGYVGLMFIIVLLTLLILNFGWYLPLILWVVPAMVAQTFLAFAFDWLPHHPHEKMERYLNTRVIDVPGISVLLLSQNYHLMHHLHPSIPFYYYKNAYDELEEEIKEKGVEIISF